MKRTLLLMLCRALLPVSGYAWDQSADINGDGQIDSMDYEILKNDLQESNSVRSATDSDLNGDGQVDIKDLAEFRKALLTDETNQ